MANPENKANDQASAPTNVPTTTARTQFEAERMTRRAALRKFGFGAGMAALLALSTDDLARMAAAKLKQQAGDNQVANQVANEFKNAGVAFADESDACDHCCNQLCIDVHACGGAYYYCLECTNKAFSVCQAEYDTCVNNYTYSYNQCADAHCGSQSCPPCSKAPAVACD